MGQRFDALIQSGEVIGEPVRKRKVYDEEDEDDDGGSHMKNLLETLDKFKVTEQPQAEPEPENKTEEVVEEEPVVKEETINEGEKSE